MSWKPTLLARGAPTDGALREAVARWRAQPKPDGHLPLARTRFAVIDLDVTGVDVRSDRLLGLGVCYVEDAAIAMGSLHRVRLADRDGAWADAQAEARFVAEVLDALGGRVLVGFHMPFVHAMLGAVVERSARLALTRMPELNLVRLLPALVSGELTEHSPLAAWLERLRIPLIREHDAVADAYAMAQALLVVIDRAEAQGVLSLRDLRNIEANRRWLRG